MVARWCPHTHSMGCQVDYIYKQPLANRSNICEISIKGVRILRLEEGTLDPITGQLLPWNYFSKSHQHNKRTPGAFRAFPVADLLRSPPVITLGEWPNLDFQSKDANVATSYPKYAAISHVWRSSEQTAQFARKANRPLFIAIEDGLRTYEISWLGLVQTAHGAKSLGCEYLWLDFLCIDQVNRHEDRSDKSLQIKNMADIYRHAKVVICMVGGASAMQRSDGQTAWVDRAWTLQEAVLNKDTWVLVFLPDSDATEGVPVRVPGEPPGFSARLVRLCVLAERGGSGRDKCLRSKMQHHECPWTARKTLSFIIKGGQIRLWPIWRAMFLRTSKKPVDIVYSVAGLFNIRLDPYDEDRDVQDVFNEFACKAATLGDVGLGWLTIDSDERRGVDKLPRDPRSLIIPKVPIYGKSGQMQLAFRMSR